MRDVLMVMNPRQIPACIRAFKALDIPKVWFSAYTEKGLEPVISKFIESTDYDNYIIASDDLVPTSAALSIVRKNLEKMKVVTGWSKQRPGSRSANLTLSPRGGFSLMRLLLLTRYADAYLPRFSFAAVEEVQSMNELFRTYFVGFSLTGMRRDLWLRFPFRTHHNLLKDSYKGSDFELSRRLMVNRVAMWCARDAYVDHLKTLADWQVGRVEPKTILELEPRQVIAA